MCIYIRSVSESNKILVYFIQSYDIFNDRCGQNIFYFLTFPFNIYDCGNDTILETRSLISILVIRL